METPTNSLDPNQTPLDTQPNQASLANSRKVIQPLSSDIEPPTVNLPPQPPSNQVAEPMGGTSGTGDSQPEPETTPSAESTHIGITGSAIQIEKKKMPVGIYVIAGFNLLGSIAGFIDNSQTSSIYTIAMFLNLLLAIGLLMRFQAARKLAVGLSVLIVLLCAVNILLLAGLQQRIKDRKADYEAAVSRLDQNRITPAQKQQLEAIDNLIASEEKKAGKAIGFTYMTLGVTAAVNVLVVVYLTRPKVKEVFHGFEA